MLFGIQFRTLIILGSHAVTNVATCQSNVVVTPSELITVSVSPTPMPRERVNTHDRSTSVTLAEMKESDTQTRLDTQSIETQTSVEIPGSGQHQPPTTVAVIEKIEPYQQQEPHKNGAIPKHSRKKSLPEAAYLTRTDSGLKYFSSPST